MFQFHPILKSNIWVSKKLFKRWFSSESEEELFSFSLSSHSVMLRRTSMDIRVFVFVFVSWGKSTWMWGCPRSSEATNSGRRNTWASQPAPVKILKKSQPAPEKNTKKSQPAPENTSFSVIRMIMMMRTMIRTTEQHLTVQKQKKCELSFKFKKILAQCEDGNGRGLGLWSWSRRRLK